MITINQLLEKTNEMLYNIRPSKKMLEDYLAELLEEYESLVHDLDFDSIKNKTIKEVCREIEIGGARVKQKQKKEQI